MQWKQKEWSQQSSLPTPLTPSVSVQIVHPSGSTSGTSRCGAALRWPWEAADEAAGANWQMMPRLWVMPALCCCSNTLG